MSEETKQDEVVQEKKNQIVIKNYQVAGLFKILGSQQITKPELVSKRNRLARLVGEIHKEITTARDELRLSFLEKGEDGRPLQTVDKKPVFTDREACEKALIEFLEQEAIFDVLPSNKASWLDIGKLFETYGGTLLPDDTILMDEIEKQVKNLK